MSKKILFVTGSLGLGHYTRDLAIASALHQLAPEVELSWLAYETVATLLEDSGEKEVLTYAYVGEVEDVVDRPLGFLLPNRRQ